MKITIVKHTKLATKNDLNRLLKSVQNLLDANGSRVWDLFKSAPIAIKVYCEENGFHRQSLMELKAEISKALT